MQKTNLFQINGKPFLPPDADVSFSFEDLDDADSGRDESGFMHRIVARYKVMSVSFSFSSLTNEELMYMESIFPEAPFFDFTYPDRLDPDKQVTKRCYRSKYGISWYDAKAGVWKNYKFNIIEC